MKNTKRLALLCLVLVFCLLPALVACDTEESVLIADETTEAPADSTADTEAPAADETPTDSPSLSPNQSQEPEQDEEEPTEDITVADPEDHPEDATEHNTDETADTSDPAQDVTETAVPDQSEESTEEPAAESEDATETDEATPEEIPTGSRVATFTSPEKTYRMRMLQVSEPNAETGAVQCAFVFYRMDDTPIEAAVFDLFTNGEAAAFENFYSVLWYDDYCIAIAKDANGEEQSFRFDYVD